MAAKPKPTPQISAEPTALEIATLAARLLPPMKLDDNWATEHPVTLKAALAEATTGKGRDFAKNYQPPPGWATPFEIVAEEATRRARILLDAAAGRIRPERLHYEKDGEKARQQMQDYDKAAAELERVFPRLAKGNSTLPITDALRHALPGVHKHNPRNPLRYWREYLRHSTLSYREKHQHPAIPVFFADEARTQDKALAVDQDSRNGPPHWVLIKNIHTVSRQGFPGLILYLREFYRTHGKAVANKWAVEDGKRGGKESQSKDKQSKFTAADTKKLHSAANRRKKTPPGA